MNKEHDFKSAIESFPEPLVGDIYDDGDCYRFIQRYNSEILHALRLADKVTGEPSKEMLGSGFNSWNFIADTHAQHLLCVRTVFEAMIATAQKEIQ